jgi:hypothetical protein
MNSITRILWCESWAWRQSPSPALAPEEKAEQNAPDPDSLGRYRTTLAFLLVMRYAKTLKGAEVTSRCVIA